MKKKVDSMFVRYFISYFVVMLVLLLGFVIVIQTQLIKTYTETLKNNVEERLTIVQDQLLEGMASVEQIDILLNSEISLLNYRYEPSTSNQRKLYKLMSNLAKSNDMIESITYLNKRNGDVVSTKFSMLYKEDICNLYVGSGRYTSFSLRRTEEDKNGKLFFLTENQSVYCLYIPGTERRGYTILYSLDLSEIKQIMKDNMVNGMEALILTDRGNSCIYGVHVEKFSENSSKIPEKSGIYEWNEEYSLYIHSNFYEGYSLVSLIEKQYVVDAINGAVRTAYLLVMLIGVMGLVLIILSMKLTYFPLAKLFYKVVPCPTHSENYVDQMEMTFSAAMTEIKQLQNKVDKYHLSIHKSLIASGIESSMENHFGNIRNLDQIFRADCENCIYMLRVKGETQYKAVEGAEQFLRSRLLKGNDFITLESGEDYKVFVVNFVQETRDKEEAIYKLLTDLYTECGCLCALSNKVSSLTEIPALYENCLWASGFWTEIPVAVYSRISREPSEKGEAVYPYKLLAVFNESLDRLDFTESEAVLERLMAQCELLYAADSRYPDFIRRSLLIDILMALFSSMNQHNVKYDIYKDLYYETLYYCRSCEWQKKRQEIIYNLRQLLELFREEQSRIRANQIQEYLEKHYASSDLEVANLADYFHVNSVYMSYVIKKELGETFVNYLWKLRFQKAMDMLLNTDLPIDKISVLVGYENTSSFRRKFKQETGLTPTQFRAQSTE